MRSKTILLAAFTFSLFLAGCGGDNTNAYDGTWLANYPALSKESTITETKVVTCSNPGANLNIKDSVGTVRISASCETITYSIDPTTGGKTQVDDIIDTYYADVSVNIKPNPNPGQSDILNAIVNGATFTGQCISTFGCSATSGSETLSLTR